MSYLWVLGAGLSVVGSVCSNLGVNIQKYSFMKNSKKENTEQKGYWKQPLWVIGFFLVFLGSLGDFAALGLAAQSIVAPIGSVTLVANIFFAHFWLEEHLSKRDMAGTCLIILGSILAVMFGDHTSVSYTLDDLKSFYLRTVFLCYVFFMIAAMVLFYGIVRKIEPLKTQLVEAEKRLQEAQRNDDYDTALKEDTLITVLVNAYHPYEKMHPFCYCALSGTFGGQSILFGKMVAELIGSSIRGDNQMKYGLTYVFLIVMLCTVFTQIHFLAKALAFFDALYVVPVFQCFFISVSTVAGASYFMEFDRFGTANWVVFPLGIIMTLSGVYVLSARDMTRERPRFHRRRKKRKVAATELTSLPSFTDKQHGQHAAHANGQTLADDAATAAAAVDRKKADRMVVSDQDPDEGDDDEIEESVTGVEVDGFVGESQASPTSPESPSENFPAPARTTSPTPARSPLGTPRRSALSKPYPLRRTNTGSGAVMLSHMYSQSNILNVNPKLGRNASRGPTTPASIRQVLSVPPSSSSGSSPPSPAIGPVPSGSAPQTPNKDSSGASLSLPGNASNPSGSPGPARTLSSFLAGLVKDVRDMTQDQWQKMSDSQRLPDVDDEKKLDDDGRGTLEADPDFQEEFYHGPVDEEGNPILDDNKDSSSTYSPSDTSRSLKIEVEGPEVEAPDGAGNNVLSPADGYSQGVVKARQALHDKSQLSFFSRFAAWFEGKKDGTNEKEGRVLFFT